MKKLIITVAPGNATASSAIEYGFLLSDGAALPDYLERVR
jgi:hypothetical protein